MWSFSSAHVYQLPYSPCQSSFRMLDGRPNTPKLHQEARIYSWCRSIRCKVVFQTLLQSFCFFPFQFLDLEEDLAHSSPISASPSFFSTPCSYRSSQVSLPPFYLHPLHKAQLVPSMPQRPYHHVLF